MVSRPGLQPIPVRVRGWLGVGTIVEDHNGIVRTQRDGQRVAGVRSELAVAVEDLEDQRMRGVRSVLHHLRLAQRLAPQIEERAQRVSCPHWRLLVNDVGLAVMHMQWVEAAASRGLDDTRVRRHLDWLVVHVDLQIHVNVDDGALTAQTRHRIPWRSIYRRGIGASAGDGAAAGARAAAAIAATTDGCMDNQKCDERDDENTGGEYTDTLDALLPELTRSLSLPLKLSLLQLLLARLAPLVAIG